MATCIATMKNTVTTVTLGRPFVLPPAAHQKLAFASSVIGMRQRRKLQSTFRIR